MEKKWFGVDKNIFLLGLVSFFTDISSEMIFAVFSIFFTIILGASTILLGIMEGLSDFAASSLDYISGYLSDRTGKRKIFAALGYGFSTLAKTILLIKNSVILAFSFRVIERLGKSFRGPPRDAWISTLADKKNKGFSFGVHKTLDKAGAVLGPFVAYAILNFYGQNKEAFAILFRVALIPAILAVLLLFVIKKEEPLPSVTKANIFKSLKTMGPGFKHYLYSAGIFSLAYFSFGFLLLKAYSVGFAVKDVILLYALFNIAFVLVAAPIGKVGDIIGRNKVIAIGYVLYFIMCIGFIFAETKFQVIWLFCIFGFFYSIDESQSKAYITDLEEEKRATAIGAYNFLTGLIYLPASIIAGFLWKTDPKYAFGFAALISVVACAFFLLFRKQE
jgi:MFS family permease